MYTVILFLLFLLCKFIIVGLLIFKKIELLKLFVLSVSSVSLLTCNILKSIRDTDMKLQ